MDDYIRVWSPDIILNVSVGPLWMLVGAESSLKLYIYIYIISPRLAAPPGGGGFSALTWTFSIHFPCLRQSHGQKWEVLCACLLTWRSPNPQSSRHQHVLAAFHFSHRHLQPGSDRLTGSGRLSEFNVAVLQCRARVKVHRCLEKLVNCDET